jgi:hypothetical protein
LVSTKLHLIYPLEEPGAHCIEGWVGIEASLDNTENLTYSEIRSLDRPVAIPSTLYRSPIGLVIE